MYFHGKISYDVKKTEKITSKSSETVRNYNLKIGKNEKLLRVRKSENKNEKKIIDDRRKG